MVAETDTVAADLKSLEGGLLPNASLNSIYSILTNFTGKSNMIEYLRYKNYYMVHIYYFQWCACFLQ